MGSRAPAAGADSLGSSESPRQITIEDYTTDEILAFPAEEVESLIFTGGPIVFRISGGYE